LEILSPHTTWRYSPHTQLGDTLPTPILDVDVTIGKDRHKIIRYKINNSIEKTVKLYYGT
jgi:hypothetical protein